MLSRKFDGLAQIPDPIPTGLSTRDVLYRDHWQCTAARRRQGSHKLHRCSVSGSEMVVLYGITLCPRCAVALAKEMAR